MSVITTGFHQVLWKISNKQYFTQRRREITHLGIKTQVDLTGEPKWVQMVSPCDEGQEVLKGKISLVV